MIYQHIQAINFYQIRSLLRAFSSGYLFGVAGYLITSSALCSQKTTFIIKVISTARGRASRLFAHWQDINTCLQGAPPTKFPP